MYEQDQPDTAETTLANRLDVIERTCVPEAVALAYLTLARVAFDRRDLGRVQDLLESLYTLGVQRRQPRMIIASLAEQVRVQSVLERGEACGLAVARLHEQREAWRHAERGVSRMLDVVCGIADIRAALCARDAHAAVTGIDRLSQDSLAPACLRDRLDLLALRCMTARLRGEPAARSTARARPDSRSKRSRLPAARSSLACDRSGYRVPTESSRWHRPLRQQDRQLAARVQ